MPRPLGDNNHITALQEQIRLLKEQNATHKHKIQRQASDATRYIAQIDHLQFVQRTLICKAREDQAQAGRDESRDDRGDDSEEEDPEPIHDGDLYFCVSCASEVVDGECWLCWKKHHWHAEMGKDSISTQNEALVQDRQMGCRGSTPLREIGNPDIHRDYVNGRAEEYIELLRRGANRHMCETFHMEFKNDTGIVAWADPILYEKFTGPPMKLGDFWKIQLGRRIQLDEDDLDGALFLEDLIEDAVLFPMRTTRSNRTQEQWETVEESPGIWVTRPMTNLEAEVDMDDDSNYPDDDSSDESDRDNEMEQYYGDLDTALGAMQEPFESSAVRADEYELENDEGEPEDVRKDDVEMEETFRPQDPDSVYIPDDEEDYDPNATLESPDSNVDMLDDSSEDSDFDSNEELSGDDEALDEASHVMQRKIVAVFLT